LLFEIEKGRQLETSTPAGKKVVVGMTLSTIPGLSDTGTLWCMLQHHALRVLDPNNPLSNLTNLAAGGGGIGAAGLPSLPSLPSGLGSGLFPLPGLPSLPDISLNSALTAVQGHFQGFTTEGYIDFSKDLGLDYSLHYAADGTLSSEIEAEATLPLLPGNTNSSLPRLTVGHQVRMCHRHPEFTALHALKMSMPVAQGKATAKVRVKQSPEGGNPGLSLEIGGRKKHQHGGFGVGTKTKNTSTAVGGNNNNSNGSNLSDDEEYHPIHENNNNNGIADENFQTMTETDNNTKNKNKAPNLCRIPQLKLDIDPLIPTSLHTSTLSSTLPRHIGLHWHQTWSSTLRTCAVYRSRSRRLQFDARAKLIPTMLVSAGAVIDSTQRTVHKAVAKVLWKPRTGSSSIGGGRHAVQLESKFSKDSGGLTHVVKIRRRPKQNDGLEASVSLNFTQENFTKPEVKFDVYLPY
jgi:hypothetical protein